MGSMEFGAGSAGPILAPTGNVRFEPCQAPLRQPRASSPLRHIGLEDPASRQEAGWGWTAQQEWLTDGSRHRALQPQDGIDVTIAADLRDATAETEPRGHLLGSDVQAALRSIAWRPWILGSPRWQGGRLPQRNEKPFSLDGVEGAAIRRQRGQELAAAHGVEVDAREVEGHAAAASAAVRWLIVDMHAAHPNTVGSGSHHEHVAGGDRRSA
jgi:hypothetical protein